jgi:putative LysE/RhtB family amino acid efflux pump
MQSLESLAILVLGLFAGSSAWWLILSVAAGAARRRVSARGIVWLNRGSAALLAVFGLIILGSAVLAHRV